MTGPMKTARDWAAQFKQIEADWNDSVDPGSWAIVRVDGRAFSQLTRKLNKPYSLDFVRWMDDVAVALCYEIQGAAFAYVQSDEVSVLVTDFKPNQGRWFGWNVNKMVSIAASTATAAFNVGYQHDLNGYLWQDKRPAVFDARVIPLISRNLAMQYFLWRQKDAHTNGIGMVAHHYYGDRALLGKSTSDRIALLMEKGVSVDTIPHTITRGRVIVPHAEPGVVEFTHKLTGETITTEVVRNNWRAQQAPWFDWDEAGFLEMRIPDKETTEA